MDHSHLPLFIPNEYREDDYDYIFYEEAFTSAECSRIIELGESLKPSTSFVAEGALDTTIRNSQNTWIGNTLETKWIYDRFANIIEEANRHYKFDLFGIIERLQFTKYTEGQYYTWHRDSGAGEAGNRKLTLVLHLSRPFVYEGGELQIFSARKEKLPNELGTVIAFPSYKDHRVSTVKKGVRYTLVAWVAGPPFR